MIRNDSTFRLMASSGILSALLLTGLPLAAQSIIDEWSFSGSNTARSTFIDNDGQVSASPYQFEGDMYYNELNLYFNRRDSDYSSWRGELSGVYNFNDDFRTTDFGLTPERLNLTRENGNSLPYRLEAGDYFAYYSFLTLQRSLKGLQIELQPVTSERHYQSVIFSTGINENDWLDITPSDDYFNSLSWLIQDQVFGAWSLNLVSNYRDDSASLGTLERKQIVYSLAGAVPFELASREFSLDMELAHFNGDHDGFAGAASGQDRADNGYLLEFRGNEHRLPLDYRLRFEHYGQDFRPRGAVVTPDRRSYEAHAGWRFNSGLRLRIRTQLFEDAYETSNRMRTRTYGLNLGGPLLVGIYTGLSGSLDTYIQNMDNRLLTFSQLSKTINLNLNAPLPYGWSGRLGLFIQNRENRLVSAGDGLSRQLTLGIDHIFNLYGWQGYISPGLALRSERKGGTDSDEINPMLSLRLNRDTHSLSMNYGSLLQDRDAALNGIDVDTHTFNLDYRYESGRHILGIEAGLFDRQPRPGNTTTAYRLSAFWSVNFDRPAVQGAGRQLASTSSIQSAAGTLNLDLAILGPGISGRELSEQLDAADISQAVEQSGYLVYEAEIFPDVFRRQRLALQFAGGLLTLSAVIIEFEDVGDQDSHVQVFERIRQSLIRELGSPARTYETGEFGANLVADINNQRLIRITEWNTGRGVIRFGIPRRLDGMVRMEIQHRTAFPPQGDTLWSIDEVR